MVFKVNKYIK